MSTPKRITEMELIARIDHKLAPSGQALYRKPATAGQGGADRFDLITVATNQLARADVELRALAREIGAIADDEEVEA